MPRLKRSIAKGQVETPTKKDTIAKRENLNKQEGDNSTKKVEEIEIGDIDF